MVSRRRCRGSGLAARGVSSRVSDRRGMHAPVICTTSPPRLHLASVIQSHAGNFGSSTVDTIPATHNQHPASDRQKVTQVTRTQPIMQLVYPRRTRLFYRGIEEDNLVLYTYRVYDRLQCHIAFQELSTGISSPLKYASGIKIKPFPP